MDECRVNAAARHHAIMSHSHLQGFGSGVGITAHHIPHVTADAAHPEVAEPGPQAWPVAVDTPRTLVDAPKQVWQPFTYGKAFEKHLELAAIVGGRSC
jgi:hypothetical protein